MPFSAEQSRDENSHAAKADDHNGHADGLGGLIGEFKEYASYFVSARWDGVKLSIRQVVLYTILGLLGLCVIAAFLATAVVLLLDGVAGGLGVLFGGRLWLGNLVVGVVILGLLAGGTILGMKRFKAKSRQKTVEKYESRKHQQRTRFGCDLHQRTGG
ncbi:MAG: phage holin family protein [Phycisphaerales bacterium]|nr:phage holin family protein [Phycisphaerales bacterium]